MSVWGGVGVCVSGINLPQRLKDDYIVISENMGNIQGSQTETEQETKAGTVVYWPLQSKDLAVYAHAKEFSRKLLSEEDSTKFPLIQ